MLVILLCIAAGWHSRAQSLWSEVQLDRNQVYVGEPVQVTISVYTATWFTRGVDPGNIKVNGAFTVYFRPLSTSVTRKGKTYAGVQLFYHVFPYELDNLEFPSLTIEVETPPEGGFKGEKRTLKTQAKTIRVKPIPPGMANDRWLVAEGMQVNDRWLNGLQKVKVGDVLERSIQLTVDGTVAELIPPITWDSIAGVSQYPARSVVENQKGKTAIAAVRTESMRYLLEKEGEIRIPAMEFTWYNPRYQKLYKRTLQAQTLQVQPNPDLGIMATMRDSLNAIQRTEQPAEVAISERQFAGLTLRQWAALLLLAGLLLFSGIRFIPQLFKAWKIKRKAYRQTEAYYFARFVSAVKAGPKTVPVNALYRWLDALNLPEASMQFFVQTYGNEKLQKEMCKMENAMNRSLPYHVYLPDWKAARKKWLASKRRIEKNNAWINP